MKRKKTILEEVTRTKEMMGILKEEEAQNLDISIDEPSMDDVELDISIDEPSREVDADKPKEKALPAHYHVWEWCKTGQQKVFINSPYGGLNPSGGGTDLQTLSQIFYNAVGSPAPGQTIHIGNVSGGGGTPREEFCITYVGFEIRTQYLDTNVLTFTTTAVDGTFSDCQDCINGGTQTPDGYCVDCVNGQMTYYPGPSGQQWTSCPQGYVDIGPTPNPPGGGPCVECQQGNCTTVGWGFGQNHYNSMSDCQSSQQCSQQVWECANGQCVPASGPLGPGQFATLPDCQGQCGNQGNTWDCTGSSPFGPPSACQQVSGSGGQFATEDDCLASPCACDDVISTWPLYLNNPNNPQGNWYGTPHDGPSNTNAIQTQLTNLQSNPNFPGGNPIQQHKMKCKEAAMQFWLGGGVNMACCQDPNFAVGAATNDPLGCVSQNFINTMNNNFIPNSPNWPGQGCNWLNNALANATAQQANFQPGTGGYCKLQGKIDFINNFKQTGSSAYVTGNASFPLPCI